MTHTRKHLVPDRRQGPRRAAGPCSPLRLLLLHPVVVLQWLRRRHGDHPTPPSNDPPGWPLHSARVADDHDGVAPAPGHICPRSQVADVRGTIISVESLGPPLWDNRGCRTAVSVTLVCASSSAGGRPSFLYMHRRVARRVMVSGRWPSKSVRQRHTGELVARPSAHDPTNFCGGFLTLRLNADAILQSQGFANSCRHIAHAFLSRDRANVPSRPTGPVGGAPICEGLRSRATQ
jgi:hypothetical protein